MWENFFKIYDIQGSGGRDMTPEEMLQKMNELGEDGWEPYSSHFHYDAIKGHEYHVVMFKRWVVKED